MNWELGAAMAAAFTSIALAGLVLTVRPDHVQNRRLSALLFIEGTAWAFTAVADLSADISTYWAGHVVGSALTGALLVAHPLFLATLDTPLARPIRSRTGQTIIWIVGGGLSLGHLIIPGRFIQPASTGGDVGLVVQPLGYVTYPLFLLLYVYAIALTVSAWRRAHRATMERRKAAAFALAFGWRDAGFMLVTVILWRSASYSAQANAFLAMAFPMVTVGFVVIASLGILRTQLFDIDLKIKLGISRTTVAAIIATAALVGSEVLERALGIDQLIPAVLIGAAMSLAIKPLMQLGDKVAGKAMPGVEDSEEYRGQRARELYQAAYESALGDGVVTDKERDMLATLQEQLGLGPTEARAIERAAG